MFVGMWCTGQFVNNRGTSRVPCSGNNTVISAQCLCFSLNGYKESFIALNQMCACACAFILLDLKKGTLR